MDLCDSQRASVRVVAKVTLKKIDELATGWLMKR